MADGKGTLICTVRGVSIGDSIGGDRATALWMSD